MTAPYRDILEEIRLAFPQPVSAPIHDSYFVHSIMPALDQVDALKSHLPILGPWYPATSPRRARRPCRRGPHRSRRSPPTSWATCGA